MTSVPSAATVTATAVRTRAPATAARCELADAFALNCSLSCGLLAFSSATMAVDLAALPPYKRLQALDDLGDDAAALAANAAAVAAQLDEKLPTIRQAALAALGKLDSAKLAAHADAVARMLADGEFGVREAAVRALARLKPAHLTPHVVDALAACLDDKDEVVRDAAHEALAVLPPASLGAHAGRLSRDQAKNHARIALGVCAPFVVLLLIAHIFGIVDLRDPVNELPKLVGIGAATDAEGNYL